MTNCVANLLSSFINNYHISFLGRNQSRKNPNVENGCLNTSWPCNKIFSMYLEDPAEARGCSTNTTVNHSLIK